MTSWEAAVPELRSAGLGTYEARVLSYLSQHGPSTGSQLSKEAKVPHGRVYSVLQTLEEQGLIEGDDGRPRLHTAVPPSIVATRLVRSARAKAESTVAQVERAAREVAATLRVHGGEQDVPLFHAAVGEDRARDELVRVIQEAEEEALALIDLGEVQEEDLVILEALLEAVRRGVAGRILLPRAQALEAGSLPGALDLLPDLLDLLGETLHVRFLDSPRTPFGVVDGEIVSLGVQNPLEPGQYFALLRVQDHRLAQALTERFHALWEQGRPVDELLGDLDAEDPGAWP